MSPGGALRACRDTSASTSPWMRDHPWGPASAAIRGANLEPASSSTCDATDPGTVLCNRSAGQCFEVGVAQWMFAARRAIRNGDSSVLQGIDVMNSSLSSLPRMGFFSLRACAVLFSVNYHHYIQAIPNLTLNCTHIVN